MSFEAGPARLRGLGDLGVTGGLGRLLGCPLYGDDISLGRIWQSVRHTLGQEIGGLDVAGGSGLLWCSPLHVVMTSRLAGFGKVYGIRWARQQ
jgi:hypothetical protein